MKTAKPDKEFSQASAIFSTLVPGKKWKILLPRRIIWQKWVEIVGQMVSQHAYPWYFQDMDCLVIAVSDNIWMQQLSFQKSDILENINARLPTQSRLAALKFFLSDVDKVKRTTMLKGDKGKKTRVSRQRKSEAPPENYLSLLEELPDEGLKEAFLRLLKRTENT